MKTLRTYPLSFFSLAVVVGLSACLNSIPRFGTGGQYEAGKEEFMRGRGGDMDKAIPALEAVVRENPTYKDSLTLLGRAYYRKTRYPDAAAILQRAVVVQKDDGIAWIVLGAAQLRLNQNEQGLQAMKGGISLFSRVSVNGYHNFPLWDTRGMISASIRRVAFLLTKEGDNKEELLNEVNTLLSRVDDEENFQRIDTPRRYNREY